MKLSNKEFNELLKELSNTPLANQDEIDFRANIEKEFRYVQKNISKTL